MNWKNSRFFNKNTFLFVLSILFLFVIIFVLISMKGKFNNNEVTLKGINHINISNKLPLTDESARNLDISTVDREILNEISFSVVSTGKKNVSSKYELYLESKESDDTINYNYVKVYLTDDAGKPFKEYSGNETLTYRNLRVSESNASGKILHVGTINGNEKQNFKLRIWVDETYSLNSAKKEFNGIIKVRKLS